MILRQTDVVRLADDPKAALLQVQNLLTQMQQALDEINQSFFTVSYAEPSRPRDLMIRFADGTEWNPGSGEGLYQYEGGTWHPLWT